MGVTREPISSLRDEDLIDLFSRRLPDLLERRPDLEPTLTFARREQVALVLTELRALRTEIQPRHRSLCTKLDHRHHQSGLRRVGQRVRRREADHGARCWNRVGHHAHIITTKGLSYRTAARRRSTGSAPVRRP